MSSISCRLDVADVLDAAVAAAAVEDTVTAVMAASVKDTAAVVGSNAATSVVDDDPCHRAYRGLPCRGLCRCDDLQVLRFALHGSLA